MIAKKAYILKIDTEQSNEYARAAAVSCQEAGVEFYVCNGWTDPSTVWQNFPIKSKAPVRVPGKGGCATAGHIMIWHVIAESGEPGIVLEHDAVLLHQPTVDIPEDMIVALGYKVRDPWNYPHQEVGHPLCIEKRKRHGGAHAYALTHNTARKLVQYFVDHGLNRMIDNNYFLRNGQNEFPKEIELGITDPICALGWLRESTIWSKAAVDNYRPILQSFLDNYNSTEDLGLKNP